MACRPLRFNSLEEACNAAGVEIRSISRMKDRATVIGDPPSRKNASVYWHSDGRGCTICNWKAAEGPRRVVWREPTVRPRYQSEKPGPELVMEIWKKSQSVHKHKYLISKCLDPVRTIRVIDAATVNAIFETHRILNNHGYPQILWHSDGPMTGPVLVVPLMRGHELRTIQFIDESGRKLLMKGLPFSGSYWCTRRTQDLLEQPTIYVAEGMATALSLDAVHDVPCVGAMSCWNMKKVALYFKKLSPKSEIVLIADNDQNGIGLRAAIDAARSVGGSYILPDFSDQLIIKFQEFVGKEKRPTDLNDFYVATGQLKKKLG